MKIYECEQGTDEWYAARLGIPTASEFSTVMAKGEGKTRKTYMLKLAGEQITGEPQEGYSNGHMERGKAMEAEARNLYAFLQDADIHHVGFIRNGDAGCSPDGLIGKDGMSEVKTKLPHLHIECLFRDDFPPEHKAQCQGGLWVAEREWIDLIVYWPKMPLIVKRAYRDEPYIKNLAAEVERFNADLTDVVARVRGYETRATP